MKRLNWLKNLGLLSATSAAIVPAILTSTSCTMTGYYVDEFEFHKVLSDASASSVNHHTESFESLLYGSKSHYNGNYILFIGSVTNDATVDFLGVPGRSLRERSKWYSEENFTQTPFYLGLVHASTDEKIQAEGMKECGFFNFIDFFDGKFYDTTGHEIFISKTEGLETTNIKPFDKWTTGIISQTKLYNKDKPNFNYEWDDTSVTDKDYIRQDDFAKAFRAICQKGLALYPKTDKRKDSFVTDDNCNTSKMVVFKDGKLVSISEMPDGKTKAGIEAFAKVVVDNYKVQKDEEKK